MKRLCVFCGSSMGNDQRYHDGAIAMGTAIAKAGMGLVYGGAAVGLMGAVADAALAAGGEVIGVIPKALMEKELGHRGLTILHVVDSMHERKSMMADLSDGFVALPGGIGTLEELFEVWTWAQLGYHAKPCGVFNLAGFYDGLAGFIDGIVSAEFMKQEHRDMLIVEDDPARLLDKIADYTPPTVLKWIAPRER